MFRKTFIYFKNVLFLIIITKTQIFIRKSESREPSRYAAV